MVFNEFEVVAALGYKGVVVALLNNSAVVHDNDLVGVADCAESVRYDDSGSAGAEVVEVLDYSGLGDGVERVGGLVHYEEAGVAIYGPGYEYSLNLAFAELLTLGAYFGGVGCWEG